MALKDPEITEKIIGCAMRVHGALGNGFQEVIYQRCMAIEFDDAGLDYKREMETPIYYKEKEVGTRRVDFLVGNGILVELKAISELNNTHYAQMINYLEAYKLEIGLLINFGEKSLNLSVL
jgi:GxxExxY protein